MNFKSIRYVAVLLVFVSCGKDTFLEKEFSCKTVNFKNIHEVKDLNKNFSISIPNNWNRELYYDEIQSEIFTADTTKQLTQTYILDASFNYGVLTFDADFHNRKNAILEKQHLKIIDSGNQSFHGQPTYWYLTEGEKNGYAVRRFNMLTILSENTYLSVYVELYGTDLKDERLCNAMALIEKIKILQ